MEPRERHHERPPREQPSADHSPSDAGNGLDALAQEGAAFASAANDIINAALSGDSSAFLAANRQMGGQ